MKKFILALESPLETNETITYPIRVPQLKLLTKVKLKPNFNSTFNFESKIHITNQNSTSLTALLDQLSHFRIDGIDIIAFRDSILQMIQNSKFDNSSLQKSFL